MLHYISVVKTNTKKRHRLYSVLDIYNAF